VWRRQESRVNLGIGRRMTAADTKKPHRRMSAGGAVDTGTYSARAKMTGLVGPLDDRETLAQPVALLMG